MTGHLKHQSSTGHLVHNTSGHLVNACAPSPPPPPPPSEPPAPCFCPAGLSNAYVLNLVGLSACSTCGGGSCSTTIAWDGTLQQLSTCRWIAQNSNFSSPPIDVCFNIQGANLSTAEITLDGVLCQWDLMIKCFASPTNLVIWHGVKTTGLTPAGDYTQTDGCVSLSTLTVV